MIQGISKILITAVFACLVTTAQAIPVNFSIQGTVDNAVAFNQFGLSTGDTVFANASFDDSLINVMGNSDVELGSTGNAFGSSLTFNIGTLSFTESDDTDYLDDIFPTISFAGGIFTGFNFISDNDDFDSGGNNQSGIGLGFAGFNAGIENVTGDWDAASASITPVASVPEPSSILLLSLGVLGLVGAKKKKYMK